MSICTPWASAIGKQQELVPPLRPQTANKRLMRLEPVHGLHRRVRKIQRDFLHVRRVIARKLVEVC